MLYYVFVDVIYFCVYFNIHDILHQYFIYILYLYASGRTAAIMYIYM